MRARCVVNMYREFVMLCWGFGERVRERVRHGGRVRERVRCVPWHAEKVRKDFARLSYYWLKCALLALAQALAQALT